jgi:hypothetical protein
MRRCEDKSMNAGEFAQDRENKAAKLKDVSRRRAEGVT